MKNAYLLFFVTVIFLSACTKIGQNDIWQGSYYENGLQENEVYGPVFNSYGGCKSWALSKIVNADDTANCAKNCHRALDDGTPICEDVVRNWAPFPGSKTFDNYKG